MAEVEQPAGEWRLRGGQYLGEISALCFLHLPSHSPVSSLPLLLSGSGSQMFVHSIESGELIRSFHVFEGIRVHGITCSSFWFAEGSPSSALVYNVAVYGERRVKLFNLTIREEDSLCVELRLLQSLPKFGHWVLDVCFLKGEDTTSVDDSGLVAVGCSDNTLSLWDATNSSMILQVHSSESSLLYSMRLWGDNLEDLRIASGTIYNEIIVWRVVARPDPWSLTSPTGESISRYDQHYFPPYEALPMCRLVGHEVRVYGKFILKRTVLIILGKSAFFLATMLEFGIVSFLKIGRGIWRCLFDPNSSVLITGGFDSGIKVYQLNSLLAQDPHRCFGAHAVSDRTELFAVRIPNSSESLGLMDSKSEYVRGLRFSSEDTLYVATNRGYLYHTKLPKFGDVTWTQLAHVSPELPIVCIDLLSQSPSIISGGNEDWLATGDGKGRATVVKVLNHADSPRVDSTFSWSAEKDRQLLGIYWCRSLGHRFIFTADPTGVIKLWRLDIAVSFVPCDTGESTHVSLLAEFASHLGNRIICLDASPQEEVLICGDLRGNLVMFPLLKDQLLNVSVASQATISPMNHFKGAHGISTVSSITVSGCSPNHIEICSTGADGCMCHLEYDRNLQIVKFVGMKQVKELSLIESVSVDKNLGSSEYAAGFASTDFIIWNLATETKVLQVPCGGWRRPHSYYFGDVPDTKNCFAYVKDEIIHIHRLWKSESGESILPRNLHLQFHGRELHSLCFMRQNPQVEANERSSWLVTGCEDGTVRLTRYDPFVENWSSSKLLGEHVGGSAVRSICCVSRTHRVNTLAGGYKENLTKNVEAFTEAGDDPVLLISVGAKRVLTSWLLRKWNPREEESLVDHQQQKKTDNGSAGSSSMSFQWLSTDMPVRNSVPPKKSEKIDRFVKGRKNGSTENVDAKVKLPTEGSLGDKYEDDWRYLAVTAFLVKYTGSRLTVCFTAVACSDATLTLRALVLPYCLWFDVAMLVPLSSPVLSLQHAIVPAASLPGQKTPMRNLYVVISGATDGSIAFWDLTGSIEAFMDRLSTLHLENLIDCQKRPRTGRGSQGGRWWRSLNSRFPKKAPRKDSETAKSQEAANGNVLDDASCRSSLFDDSSCCTSEASKAESPKLEKKSADNSVVEISEISPLYILNSVHQSGVNCLHVSEAKHGQCSDGGSMYCIVSGGDDQALHCLTFEVLPQSSTPDPEISTVKYEYSHDFLPHGKHCVIKLICRDNIASGHSSAVKGVWTDGTWVLSTGLDQRVRCWILSETGKVTEHSHLIISVPEPEALDVRACGRDRYQIAVAGRGMQMIDFSAEMQKTE
ncbi:hypothetical protein CRG98_044013 [Punica granatum]|uniref:WD repeat-containing protein 6 n=1 Tax=Punica granatum TaxID=22663 RepID=A0A2I0HV32_PUNGR|nr:hypothetical protein CRG98_044013 [Punica granatum]